MADPPSLFVGSAHIASGEAPDDARGLVVYADGFAVVADGRALIVTLPPGEVATIARRLLREARRRRLAISGR